MKERGVTLLELLVTMTIVVILASVAMPLSRVSTKRAQEIELRQHLRVLRNAIDTFKLEWNRDGEVLLGPVCVKNKLTCKEVTSPYGYPKSLDVLLEVKLTGEEATVRGTTIRRYLRVMPLDPLTGKADWLLRCYKDSPKPTSWCGEDVYDVMTRSDADALDGTKYQDW
ncbi:type II secretion system protein [Nitrospira moscoviensis]|uniref:General secretion pathway protein G n=1 Tax=Nitrospira moscoviensis TaxID=42253 RepID=A0A0K2GFM3_NITMO|nr:type II secretion system protein [Nitrospira moscoviensis]ALA59760.1 General secretion pathway protein G [Nitrospira moscoviensis]